MEYLNSRSKDNKSIKIGNLSNIHTVKRSRKRKSNTDYDIKDKGWYNIGALTDPSDKKLDIDNPGDSAYDNRTSPLLSIYIIDKNSETRGNNTGNGKRRDLFYNLSKPSVDIVGLGIIFPKSQDPADNRGGGYRGQD